MNYRFNYLVIISFAHKNILSIIISIFYLSHAKYDLICQIDPLFYGQGGLIGNCIDLFRLGGGVKIMGEILCVGKGDERKTGVPGRKSTSFQ